MSKTNYNYKNSFKSPPYTAIQPWIEWKHITMGKTHCPTCLKLNKCWFTKTNMPLLPQHKYCHCTTVSKSCITVQKQATANSSFSKFNPYLFDTNGAYKHGKDKLFVLWGYTVEDSQWLKAEIERQGLEKYVAGQYKLNRLDHNGQRININIKIPRKDKNGEASFMTGWMVYPTVKSSLPHRMRTTDMKEMDIVEIIVNKEQYANEGVYKGMQGWICLDNCTDGYWLVNLPQYGAKPDIATISIHENDMIVIPRMDARINEKIKAEHE